ncbi:mismatch-specific DNA-glycosylase [Brooklawnia cerclae]|uniref:TDG/mug DNA glycosylase family protein n=1 Tax=Brooklawnia cerclae TaxID=349934 RepID=A0ABX0SIB2_9ACTN|nr:mismatch-specific DNA-glycosylase [Brooklawnia cerclae]NIH56805.1 TDG/mug DNA glycosylase family protein [Brooklawnia cerclae]
MGDVSRPTPAELRAVLDRLPDPTRLNVPDIVGDGMAMLIVGINPGLWSAAVGAHFARPGNRFWPALHEAGIVDRPVDPSEGLSEDDRDYLVGRGVGLTNLVDRPTVKADELDDAEVREGVVRLRGIVERYRPRVVAIAGIGAYRVGFARPRARPGEQPEPLAGARVWALPNPSGLNAHENIASLARAYGAAADAAGIIRVPGGAIREAG